MILFDINVLFKFHSCKKVVKEIKKINSQTCVQRAPLGLIRCSKVVVVLSFNTVFNTGLTAVQSI
jgi:hypothetical protein